MERTYQRFDLLDLEKPTIQKNIQDSKDNPIELKDKKKSEDTTESTTLQDHLPEKTEKTTYEVKNQSLKNNDKKAFVYKPPVTIGEKEKAHANTTEKIIINPIDLSDDIVDGIDMSYYEDTPVDIDDEKTHSNKRIIIKGLLVFSAIVLVIFILLIVFC